MALTVIGAVLLLAGAVLLYARNEVIDQNSFADRAEAALEDDDVRKVVSREIVVNVIDRGSTDLVAARPVIESVVDAAIDTNAFRKLFRSAAVQANRLFFVREKKNFVFDLADASEIVRFGLQSVSPGLAKQVPPDLDVALLNLKQRDFAQGTLDAADSIRVLGLVLPLLAVIALAGGVWVAPDRRVGLMRAAIAVAAVGVLVAIALLVLRETTLNGVYGDDELTDEEVRGAVGGFLDAFFGGLFGWGLVMAFTGLVVAGAAAALDPEQLENPATRLRERVTREPRTTWGKAVRGIAVVAIGFFIALEPGLALRLVAILLGAYLVFFGVSELLVLLQPPEATGEAAREGRKRTLAITGGVGAAVVAVVAVILIVALDSADDPSKAAVPSEGCNGSPELCKLPLNQVAFAGTHNSFSAADTPGWFIANQRRDIERQLRDGVRLFLIDPHWGVQGADGKVRTDFEAEGRDRNRVAANLPPSVLAAAERLTSSLGVRENEGGERDVWLCHTVCELGATRMEEALTTIREFLDANPGEVVILFIEPYVPPVEIAEVFKRSGMDRYVTTLFRSQPLPTLGQLVRSNERAIVFTEKDADGTVPWYLDGFSFVQDTPLGATKPKETSCDLNRGSPDSPLLMLNHWADVFPPRLKANEGFLKRRFILERARECARARGLPVSLIASDFYDTGDLVEAIDAINAERTARLVGS
ncbi:MAG TPA: hypothetical protein VHH72_02050 [Solirubrobacterales bacterium]|nr:hypothetical protein [Solirubrobacterales bacterium]